METIKSKPKRKLSNIDFSGKSSHIALVSKEQGGPASGADYQLVLKATESFEEQPTALELVEAIKSVRKKRTKESEPAVAPVVTTESDNSTTNASVEKQVEPSGSVTKSKGELMTEKVQDKEVANDALVEVQKALNEQKEQAEAQKVELQKALAQIAEFKQLQKAAIVKAKTDKVNAVIKNVEHQAIIAKACLELESEEDFTAFMAAMTAMQAQVGTSEMFVEKGLQSSVDKPAEAPITALIKAKYNK